MDRLEAIMAAAIAQRRAELISRDMETDPALRSDRTEVAPGCRLKPGDDVLVFGEVKRVVCPTSGSIGWFDSVTLDNNGYVWGQNDASTVTDRVPADPEEEALPIFVEPAP